MENMMRESGKVRKRSKGRKKIEIKKIEKQSSRQVTFSKRRVGLFKKASELCFLSGAQVAIVVHSHGKRVFSFGHPNPDAIIHRFLRGESSDFSMDQAEPNMVEYNEHYSYVSKELDAEKRRAGEYGGGSWWLDDVEGRGVEELEQYVAALDKFKNKVMGRANDIMVVKTSNSFLPAAHNPHMGVAPPLTSAMLDDAAEAFLNSQGWSGYDFGFGPGNI